MRVRFWGTRGSVPTPGPSTIRYGGNTSCVELRTDADTCFIFDSGTGIRELGLHLARQGGPVAAHLLLGHTHWDHISGFPFFSPAFVPGNQLMIYGAHDRGRPLRDVLAGQMHETYFPVPLGDLRADIRFCELDETSLTIGDARIRTCFLNHTAPCMGYRVEADGVSFAYITDHEPFGRPNSQTRSDALLDQPPGHLMLGGDRRLIDFVRGVDLLVQDTQYTPEEYATRHGWGHGSSDYVTDVAIQAGVRRLALFHHEPTHDDEAIDRMTSYCRERARGRASRLDLFAAAEGLELVV